MTRLEQITAKALERVRHDRYLLAKAVGKRAEELSSGATPLVEMDIKKHKATDIALHEIAEGKLSVELES
ncbi:DNA-directed RNA polymerase subunit omega [Nitratifractor sp.]